MNINNRNLVVLLHGFNIAFTDDSLQYNKSGNLASIYYEQGNLEMAIFHFKRAISLDSGFLEAYNNLVGHLFFPLWWIACSELVFCS